MPEVKPKERAALFVVCLSNVPSDSKWAWLYRTMEDLVGAAANTARPAYGTIVTLRGDDATAQRVVDTLARLGKETDVEAVDLFLSVHGGPHRLYFADGGIDAKQLGLLLKKSGARHLRAVYSTACYGASHAPHFVLGGFQVASGAVGVNCNGATEYPFFIGKWCLGYTYEKALRPENDAFDEAQDRIAEGMGFEGADSEKKIYGDESQKIGLP